MMDIKMFGAVDYLVAIFSLGFEKHRSCYFPVSKLGVETKKMSCEI